MKRLSGVFFAITVFISGEVGAWKSYTAVCYTQNGDNGGPVYGDITSECNAIGKTEASFQSITEWNDGKAAVVSEAGSLKVTSVGAYWMGVGGDGSWAWLDDSDFSYCPPDSSDACDDTSNWNTDWILVINSAGELIEARELSAYCFLCYEELSSPVPTGVPTTPPTSCADLEDPFGSIGLNNNQYTAQNTVVVSWVYNLFPGCVGTEGAFSPESVKLSISICFIDGTGQVATCYASGTSFHDASDTNQIDESTTFTILRNFPDGNGDYVVKLTSVPNDSVFGYSAVFVYNAAPTPLPSPPPSAPLSTDSPTQAPSYPHTYAPTQLPTQPPSARPTGGPTLIPTSKPSLAPSQLPSSIPTPSPTSLPTLLPSPHPTTTFSPTTGTPYPTLPPTSSPTPWPTTPPSPLPSSNFPSPLPTNLPTQYCDVGNWFDGRTCTPCGIGRFSVHNGTAPFPTYCTSCPVGKYASQIGSSQCDVCPPGRLSSEDFSICISCNAGQYSYQDVECRACERGRYAPQALREACLACESGARTNNVTGSTSCIACDAGRYSPGLVSECGVCPHGAFSGYRSSLCYNCSPGYFAAEAGSTACTSCSAGKFSNRYAATSCESCPLGKFQSATSQQSCDPCAPKTFAGVPGSLGCTACGVEYDSGAGASSCDLAAEGYYLPSDDLAATACPKNANCAGGQQAPAPEKGFWQPLSTYAEARFIYRCPRKTCIGAMSSDPCWAMDSFRTDDDDGGGGGGGGGGSNASAGCSAERRNLCAEGAWAALCGSCMDGYIYRSETKACGPCQQATTTTFAALGAVAGAALVVALAWLAIAYDWLPAGCCDGQSFLCYRVLQNIDSGALRCCWVTFQIIMSTSWNLDVLYPEPFSTMLGLMGIFSLDFLALECFQEGVNNKYFTTVLLWCTMPIVLAFCILAIGALRVAVKQLLERNAQDTTAATSRIANQHAFFLLLLSYLILPPVSNKQLQALDCVPLDYNGMHILRSDSAIDCGSPKYLRFRAVVILFIMLYQSIPICWLLLLYRERRSLNPSTSNHDTLLALHMRDQDTSLDSIRFLFNDYVPSKWWFEIVEMYRRIVIVGIIPLCSPVTATRASLGVVLSIVSLMFFREERPYREKKVNLIAYVAQIVILVTFYGALSIDTGVMVDFGLKDLGMGLFLCGVNLAIIGMVVALGWSRQRKEQRKHFLKSSKATQVEDARTFTVSKFRSTFDELLTSSVPASHAIVFSYGTLGEARGALRSGVPALSRFGGVPFSTRMPLTWTVNEEAAFAPEEEETGAERPSGRTRQKSNTHSESLRHAWRKAATTISAARKFSSSSPPPPPLPPPVTSSRTASSSSATPFAVPPVGEGVATAVEKSNTAGTHSGNGGGRHFEAVLVAILPLRVLEPLPGFNEDPNLHLLSAAALRAMRPFNDFSALLEPKPWHEHGILLPPTSIVRCYQLADQLGDAAPSSQATITEPPESLNSGASVPLASPLLFSSFASRPPILEGGAAMPSPHIEIRRPTSVSEYLVEMRKARARAKGCRGCQSGPLLPLYHYTSESVLPLIAQGGLLMSTQGQGDGGVYFSTLSPASYEIGTPHYERNIIRDCFGVERTDEYVGKDKVAACVVYGCCARLLQQAPGGRNNARFITRRTFDDLSLPRGDGRFYLRPDCILAAFVFNLNDPPSLDPDKPYYAGGEPRQKGTMSVDVAGVDVLPPYAEGGGNLEEGGAREMNFDLRHWSSSEEAVQTLLAKERAMDKQNVREIDSIDDEMRQNVQRILDAEEARHQTSRMTIGGGHLETSTGGAPCTLDPKQEIILRQSRVRSLSRQEALQNHSNYRRFRTDTIGERPPSQSTATTSPQALQLPDLQATSVSSAPYNSPDTFDEDVEMTSLTDFI